MLFIYIFIYFCYFLIIIIILIKSITFALCKNMHLCALVTLPMVKNCHRVSQNCYLPNSKKIGMHLYVFPSKANHRFEEEIKMRKTAASPSIAYSETTQMPFFLCKPHKRGFHSKQQMREQPQAVSKRTSMVKL